MKCVVRGEGCSLSGFRWDEIDKKWVNCSTCSSIIIVTGEYLLAG